MKLLFLANRIPYPPYRGDKLKIYNLAKRLCKQHELVLLTFTECEEDKKYKAALEEVFTEVHLIPLPKWKSAINCLAAIWNDVPLQVLYFKSKAMKTKLDELLFQTNFDVIHVQHLRMAPYLAQRKDLKRILDLPDAFSLYWKRRQEIKSSFFKSWFEKIEQLRLMRYERVIKDYQLSLVCSQEDKEYLEQLHQATNIELLPNGVDRTTFAPRQHDYTSNSTLLFTGNMDYAPNVDAVIYFVKDILPFVKQQFPNIIFIIAGQRPVEQVKALAGNGVQVTGFVEDLAAVYNEASVVVAPLRFGAGTQNKVLEAMAMGVPVVCSAVGFKGLGIASGEGAIMETDPKAFAEAICHLLRAEDYRKQVGHAGAKLVANRFDWEAITRQLEHYLQQVKDL